MKNTLKNLVKESEFLSTDRQLFLPAAKRKEERLFLMFSLPECISWLAVGLMLFVAIVTLNLITVIVFIKNRNFRKRSTYLVINLAVVDMLAGAFAINSFFHAVGEKFCNLWKYSLHEKWKLYTFFAVFLLFPVASLTNITAIALERLHATFKPITHRELRTWIYRLIILIIWATASLVSIMDIVLLVFKKRSHFFYLWNSFNTICLLIICISYSSIVIKVRCGAQPRHHGAANKERKLTMTLFIVTLVSLLMWLPYVITSFLYFASDISSSLSILAISRLNLALVALYHSNSLVNPILYTVLMPGFRRAVVALFRKRPQQQNQGPVIPLRDM